MYILAIETTGAFASVALQKSDKIIGHVTGSDRFSHLQNLMPQVESVIKENKLSLGDIDVIAVSSGPGSFTGIRIGVSSARALSQMLRIPVVAVPSLKALALRGEEYAKAQLIRKEQEGGNAEGLLICPMLDARRSQVYAGGYLLEGDDITETIEAGPYMLDEFLQKAEGYSRILLLGDAVDTYGEKIKELRPEGTETTPESIRYQDAAFVAKLGSQIYDEEGGLDYNDVKPQYMRLAEAERKLREKQQKG